MTVFMTLDVLFTMNSSTVFSLAIADSKSEEMTCKPSSRVRFSLVSSHPSSVTTVGFGKGSLYLLCALFVPMTVL